MTATESIRVRFNDTVVEVRPGATLLAAARRGGIVIPSLCWDPRLTSIGACRLCLVEIEGRPSAVAACTTPAAGGMVVHTHTPALERHRRNTLSMLARNYPATDAERFASTPFVALLESYGVKPEGAPGGPADRRHPYIAVDMSRCILCFRCVRICDELQGQNVWHIENRSQARECGYERSLRSDRVHSRVQSHGRPPRARRPARALWRY